MKVLDKYVQYYKPDIYVSADDVCSSDGLFMSKAMYDEMLLPYEVMLIKKAVSLGLIVEHHVCGKAEAIMPELIDAGVTIWQMAQPGMNDVKGFMEKYDDRVLIHGGWDSFGPHNYDDCTEEEVRAAVRKCIDEFHNNGHYTLFPVCMGDMADPRIQARRFWIDDECHKYRPWLNK